MFPELDDVIAMRELTLHHSDGATTPVLVRLARPRHLPASPDFECRFQILGLGDDSVQSAGGVDAIQALLNALALAGSLLKSSLAAQEGRLNWLRLPDFGFPDPNALLPPGIT